MLNLSKETFLYALNKIKNILNTHQTKLDTIEEGAQANTVTGIKGNAESSYRTGKVNLTPANVGALPLTGGTLTGTLNTQTVRPVSDDTYFLGDSSHFYKRAYLNGICFNNGSAISFIWTGSKLALYVDSILIGYIQLQ